MIDVVASTDESARSEQRDEPTSGPSRIHVVIEVSLPDRPGALGAVASRIGAVGGDITDVIVASRSEGFAEDVFHVDLPAATDDVDLVGLVLAEVSQVDGVNAPSVSRRDEECCD